MQLSFFAAVFSLAIVTVKGANNPDDPNGSSFYVTKPSCNYYRCQVQTHPGDILPIEWLNPIKGKIDIFFNPEEENKGLKTYSIAKNLGAHHDKGKCNDEGQNGCGSFAWKVPANVKPGNYSVEIHSLKEKKVYGYSDIVTVVAKKGKRKASSEMREEHKDDKKHHKNTTETVKHDKHHKNATEPAHHHKHDHNKNAKETAKHHEHHKNETQVAKHHKDGKKPSSEHDKKKTLSSSKHHHKNETKSSKEHEHKKHDSTSDNDETKKERHHRKHHNKTRTSEQKHKRMQQVSLF